MASSADATLEAVRADGLALEHASPSARDSLEIVLAAVSQNGDALAFASQRLQAEKSIVMAAVTQTWRALSHATPQLQGDRDVALCAVRQSSNALYMCNLTEPLRNDAEVMTKAVAGNGMLLEKCSPALRDDASVVFAAVRSDGLCLRYAGEQCKSNPWVLVEAVAQEGNALVFANTHWQAGGGLPLKKFVVEQLMAYASLETFMFCQRRVLSSNSSNSDSSNSSAHQSFPERAGRLVAAFAGAPVGRQLTAAMGAAKRRGWTYPNLRLRRQPSRAISPRKLSPNPSRVGSGLTSGLDELSLVDLPRGASPFPYGATNQGVTASGYQRADVTGPVGTSPGQTPLPQRPPSHTCTTPGRSGGVTTTGYMSPASGLPTRPKNITPSQPRPPPAPLPSSDPSTSGALLLPSYPNKTSSSAELKSSGSTATEGAVEAAAFAEVTAISRASSPARPTGATTTVGRGMTVSKSDIVAAEVEVWAPGTWKGNDHMNLVVPGLYLGDIVAAQSSLFLKLGGVTHVVDLSNSTVDATQLSRGASSKNTHYEVNRQMEGCDWTEVAPGIEAKLVVRVDDEASADLRPHFIAMNRFISQGNFRYKNESVDDAHLFPALLLLLLLPNIVFIFLFSDKYAASSVNLLFLCLRQRWPRTKGPY